MFQKNKAEVIGNLGATPTLRATGSGVSVTNLSVATSRNYRTANGESRSETTWHKIAVFGKTAEACCSHLQKGDLVSVEGRLSNREYEDKDGIKRFVTEIVAEKVDWGPKRPQVPATE